jgi:hypothetical protein
MSRQRRRRSYAESEAVAVKREESADERETKVMFLEQVDYKMEIEHH